MSEKVLNVQEASAILNAMSELPDKKCITAIEAQEMLSNMSVIPINLGSDLADGTNVLFCNHRSNWCPGLINIDNDGQTDYYDMQESRAMKILSIRGDMANGISLEIQSEQAWDRAVIIAFDYVRNIAKCSIVYEERFTTMTANYSDGRFLAVVEYN
jgi:hypothetical protein